MKINIWYDDLTPAEATDLVGILANFERSRAGAPQVVPVLQPAPEPKMVPIGQPEPAAQPTVEQVVQKAKRGLGKKGNGEAKPDAPAPVTREALIAKLRTAVQTDYDSCEKYLEGIGKESFLTLSDTELAAAVTALVK